MKGRGPIVLKVDQHSFHEHDTIELARREAERLTDRLGGKMVVYVPVLLIEKPPQYAVSSLLPDMSVEEILRQPVLDADLPF